jgi:anti-sigma B factor antagonist
VLDVELNIRDVDGRAVVALCGELDVAGAPGAGSHLIVAMAACGPSVIVDLTGLTGMSNGGLSMLLRVRKWALQNGGDLLLAAPRRPVRRVLEATGLLEVFSVYRSVEEAVTGMKPASSWSSAVRSPWCSGTRRPRHAARDTWTKCRPGYVRSCPGPRRI